MYKSSQRTTEMTFLNKIQLFGCNVGWNGGQPRCCIHTRIFMVRRKRVAVKALVLLLQSIDLGRVQVLCAPFSQSETTHGNSGGSCGAAGGRMSSKHVAATATFDEN